MKPALCPNAAASTVVSLAPGAVGLIVERHTYSCGCMYRVCAGVTYPQRYVAAVMRGQRPAGDGVAA